MSACFDLRNRNTFPDSSGDITLNFVLSPLMPFLSYFRNVVTISPGILNAAAYLSIEPRLTCPNDTSGLYVLMESAASIRAGFLDG